MSNNLKQMSTSIKETSTNFQNLITLNTACEVNDTLKKISPRWKMTILYEIQMGSHQFSKLKQKFPSLSDQILGKRLRELEKENFVIKELRSDLTPNQIIYHPTKKGLSLLKIMAQLHIWTKTW